MLMFYPKDNKSSEDAREKWVDACSSSQLLRTL